MNKCLSKVTRVTVVTEDGIQYENYNAYKDGCVVMLQDEGRTVKILPSQFKEEQ